MEVDGFCPIFERASSQQNLPFERFRSDPAYHFILPIKMPTFDQRYSPDFEYLKLGMEIDINLCIQYLKLDKPKLGYEGIDYYPLDMIDSRHIMFSTMLFSKLPNIKRVLEIGAGFGNVPRLNVKMHEIEKWTIFDLPFVLKLQEWFLSNCLDPADLSKMEFCEAGTHYEGDGIDLIIAAHSLSEISLEKFMNYAPILSKTKYLYYARHQYMPNFELSKHKVDFLLSIFNVVSNIQTEGGYVDNFILELK